MSPNNRTPSHRPSRGGDSCANPMAIGGHGLRPSQGPGPSIRGASQAPANMASQAPANMYPTRRIFEAQGGQVYSGGDPRMMAAVDARPVSHHPSRQSSMSPPPPFAGRSSQAGRMSSRHMSQAEVDRVPSYHSSQTGRGPSAVQQGGFSDQDFVKVGRAPSHAAKIVKPRQPSRRPFDILPNHCLNMCPSEYVLLQPQPRPQQVDQRLQQFGPRLQQHDSQRPVIDTSIYHGQVGASG
jgi:hypothetical protein